MEFFFMALIIVAIVCGVAHEIFGVDGGWLWLTGTFTFAVVILIFMWLIGGGSGSSERDPDEYMEGGW